MEEIILDISQRKTIEKILCSLDMIFDTSLMQESISNWSTLFHFQCDGKDVATIIASGCLRNFCYYTKDGKFLDKCRFVCYL